VNSEVPLSSPKTLLEKFSQWLAVHRWIQMPLFIFCWIGVWLIGYVVEYVNHASVWFPAAGLTFSSLLVIGPRIIPALIVCAILSTYLTGYFYQIDQSFAQLTWAGLIFAIGHIAPYHIAAAIIKHFSSDKIQQLPSLLILSFVSVFFSSLATSLLVIYGLVFTGLMDVNEMISAWLPFWIGDMAGIIAIGPIFVGILCKVYDKPQFWIGELKEITLSNNSDKFTFKLIGCAVLIILIMLLAYLLPVHESNLAIFIMILPLMWISFTESPARTAISVGLFSTSIAFLVNLLGLMDFVLIYQFAICIVAASAFLCLSVPSLLAHNETLKNKMITDHLTGAASRSHLVNQADIEIAKSLDEGKPLSLIVFDLDNFKGINDSLGHNEGDKVLIETSRIAALNLRKSDLLSRHGGDEFVILLPNTKLDEAGEVAEKILKQIQKADLKLGFSFSCSFGASQLKAGDDFKLLFERADKALYQAKDGGRNQVQVCQESLADAG